MTAPCGKPSPALPYCELITTGTIGTSRLRSSNVVQTGGGLRQFAIGLSVLIIYIATAKAGFQFAFVAEQVTTVWAPTGIAVASLLLWGPQLWPAIWLGAFVVNAGTTAPPWTAVVVASGNTLEALTAVWALRRIPSFDVGFQRLSDALAFVLIAVVGCTSISATVGSVTLCAAGAQPWSRFAALWSDWWLGDALGALIVAPPILTLASLPRFTAKDAVRLTVFVGSSVMVTHLVFGRLVGPGAHPLEYVVFPLMIAAAVAGSPPVTSAVVLASSAVTIWNTVRGAGPFAGTEVHHALVLLQTFTGVLATTALLLSAAIAERRTIELRHRESADELRRREELLRLAQRAGGVATFEWDFRNQIARCSAEFFGILGLPSQDGRMKGDEWAQFVHPDDRERMSTHLARALAGTEPATADYRIIRADGVERWLLYAGQVEHLSSGARMLGTVLDITERKRMEGELRGHAVEVERILETLRESRDVLSLAMRGGSMGAWSRNLVTNEVWWSRELEEIVGLEPGGFAQTEAGFFDIVHPDDRPVVRHAVDTAVETQSDYVVEFRFQHASGEWRWMEGRGRAVYTEGRAPKTLYGLAIDVTNRKRAEAALREAKDDAESANRLKDQFLATLSHELRTPLNAILGYARMLQTNVIAPEKRQRAFDIIERNAAVQNQLIEDLLDISRITRGQVRLEPTPVPLATVLREAIEVVRPAADARRIALDLDIDPFAGFVNADAARLQQVFWNLLTNAVKFTDPGGRVAATLRRAGDDVEVSVVDSGIGISREFLPFVFEPFRQADARQTRVHGGLGLGLAISRQLVELHGGTIAAASEGPGMGATFIVRLPARLEPDAPPARATLPDASVATGVTGERASLDGVEILVVDDDEDALTLFRESLEGAGATVRTVTSGADAIREDNDRPAHLLITDLALPGMDGFELLRALRQTHPNITAVAVTAFARLDDRARALTAGFQAHISKPIDPRLFVRTVASVVAKPR